MDTSAEFVYKLYGSHRDIVEFTFTFNIISC